MIDGDLAARQPANGGLLEQADGTSWMAFYCATMLSIALELAEDNPAYETLIRERERVTCRGRECCSTQRWCW